MVVRTSIGIRWPLSVVGRNGALEVNEGAVIAVREIEIFFQCASNGCAQPVNFLCSFDLNWWRLRHLAPAKFRLTIRQRGTARVYAAQALCQVVPDLDSLPNEWVVDGACLAQNLAPIYRTGQLWP